jgi:hypothetical protein
MKVAELIREYRDKHPDNGPQCRALARCLVRLGPVEHGGRLWIGSVGTGIYGVENHPLPTPGAESLDVPESILEWKRQEEEEAKARAGRLPKFRAGEQIDITGGVDSAEYIRKMRDAEG